MTRLAGFVVQHVEVMENAAGVVDRVLLYLAPALLGDGPSIVAQLGAQTMADIKRLRLHAVRVLGQDVRLELDPTGLTAAVAAEAAPITPYADNPEK